MTAASLRNLFFIPLCLSGDIAFGAGIVTPFVDVNMGVIQTGKTTPVQAPGGDGLLIFNKEDKAVHIHVDVEAIPDPTWIHISPNDAVIPPHQSVLCRMAVTVPAIVPAGRRHYNALVITRIDLGSKAGISIQGALQSHLRFTVNAS